MKLLVLIVLLLATETALGQEINSVVRQPLLDSTQINQKRLVTLFETNSFTVLTTYPYLNQHLTGWTKKHPDIVEDKVLFEKIRLEATKPMIRADRIAAKFHLQERLNFRAGSLLQSGNCFIYNKLTNRREKIIKIARYGGYAYGAEGRRYLIGKTLLLDNIEVVW